MAPAADDVVVSYAGDASITRRGCLRLAAALGIGWSSIAAAQDRERVRVIAVLISLPSSDRLAAVERVSAGTRLPGMRARLQALGWVEGRNIRFEIRAGLGDADMKQAMKELVDLAPDVIVTSSSPSTVAAFTATRTIPIVFATAADPVGSGLVKNLTRPGGNVTGFTNGTADIGGKWVQFLKEIAPRLRRAGVLFNPKSVPREGRYYLDPIAEAAPAFDLAIDAAPIRDASAIDAIVASFAGDPAGGLIVPPDSFTVSNRDAIVAATARHRVPAIYSLPYFMTAGGLMSYGAGLEVRAAEYIDLILRGAKPGDLPVQSPRSYELLINRKVAAGLGLTLPASLLARAGQIIE
jgi:putative ABC transport system substrate-binding protein